MSFMKKKKKKEKNWTECRTWGVGERLFSTKCRIRRNVIFDEVVFDEMSCTDFDISDSFKNSTLKLNYILSLNDMVNNKRWDRTYY